MTKITTPGFYVIAPSIYHADPCPEPSLSSTIARTLIRRSPFHAHAEHPRFTEQPEDESDRARDIGAGVHAMSFGGREIVRLPEEFQNYNKGDPKKLRDAAYALDQIPLLDPDYKKTIEMAPIVREYIADLVKREGKYAIAPELLEETAIIWREGDMWCRTQIDTMTPDRLIYIDLKTSEQSAAPAEVQRRFYSDGSQIQAAFIRRGLDALHPEGRGRRKCFFVYIETKFPYGISSIEVTEAGMEMGARQVRAALNLWDKATRTDTWPSYPREPQKAAPPQWTEAQWYDRELNDPTINLDELYRP